VSELLENLIDSHIQTLIQIVLAFGDLAAQIKHLLLTDLGQRGDPLQNLPNRGVIDVCKNLLHDQILIRSQTIAQTIRLTIFTFKTAVRIDTCHSDYLISVASR